MNDGKNGSYQTIYLQNNENYGNLIRYRSSKLGYIDVGSSVIGEESYSDSIPEEYKFATQEALWLWPADASIPIENIQMENEDITEKDFCENPKDKTTISEIDARKTADELLEKLDIHDLHIIMADLSVKQPVIVILPVRQKKTRHTHIVQSMHYGINAVSKVFS